MQAITLLASRTVTTGTDAVVVWLLDEGATSNAIDAMLGLDAASPAWTSFER